MGGGGGGARGGGEGGGGEGQSIERDVDILNYAHRAMRTHGVYLDDCNSSHLSRERILLFCLFM